MATRPLSQRFSGSAKVWEDFAADFPELTDDDSLPQESAATDEFRDEYVRLPYDDVPQTQECRW